MKRPINPLGETEMEVLNIVWDLKEASVSDIQERILKKRKVAYTTIMTVTKNLADKGFLTYRKVGNSYIYSAREKPDNVKHNVLSSIVKKVFQGSPAALIQNLVEHEDMSDEDIERIQSMINKLRDNDDD